MNRIHQTHIRLIRLIRIATETHKIHQANATHERISCSERPKLLFSLSLHLQRFQSILYNGNAVSENFIAPAAHAPWPRPRVRSSLAHTSFAPPKLKDSKNTRL